MTRPNRILTIGDLDQLIRWWKFLREGLDCINRETGWSKQAEDFLKFLMHVVDLSPDHGVILVLVSGAGIPYGYAVVVDNTNRSSQKTVNIYAVYTNKKCPSTLTELSAEAFQWAKSRGFREAQACSYRVTGASDRFFKRHFKFDRKFVVYQRTL